MLIKLDENIQKLLTVTLTQFIRQSRFDILSRVLRTSAHRHFSAWQQVHAAEFASVLRCFRKLTLY